MEISRANKGWMHDTRQKLPTEASVHSPQIFFFPSVPPFLEVSPRQCLFPRRTRPKIIEIYLRYKYRWLIVTTNTFARISSGTQPSDLSRQSWKKRKGSWIMGAQSTWPAPETFHRNPRIRFANTRWNLVCGICGMKYLFSSTRGRRENVFPGGEL